MLARLCLRPTLPWLAGFRVAGRRRIPREGGVVVVVNHVGDLDPLFVGVACVPGARCTSPTRGTTAACRSRGCCSRWARSRWSRAAPTPARCATCASGSWPGDLIVVFAEGRAGWGAPMGEFLEGAGHLGLTPGVTVVPAAIWGVQHFMRGWRPVGRGPVLVAFGHPVPVPKDGPRRERAAELTRRTRAAVAELLEPMMRAHP